MLRRSMQFVLRVLQMEPHKNFKGRDLFGNEYYEVPAQKFMFGMREVVKLRRTIEPPNMSQYKKGGLESGKNVPTEWWSWLQMRRQEPPTLKEVEQNFIRMHNMEKRVKQLEQALKKPKEPSPPLKKKIDKLEQTDVESWGPK